MDCSLNWSYINYMEIRIMWWLVGRPAKGNLTGGCHFYNMQHICGDIFHTLQCPGVSGVEMKIYERSLQALLSLPHTNPTSPPPPLLCLPSCSTHACTFHDTPKWRACLQAAKDTIIDPNHSVYTAKCEFSSKLRVYIKDWSPSRSSGATVGLICSRNIRLSTLGVWTT